MNVIADDVLDTLTAPVVTMDCHIDAVDIDAERTVNELSDTHLLASIIVCWIDALALLSTVAMPDPTTVTLAADVAAALLAIVVLVEALS